MNFCTWLNQTYQELGVAVNKEYDSKIAIAMKKTEDPEKVTETFLQILE